MSDLSYQITTLVGNTIYSMFEKNFYFLRYSWFMLISGVQQNGWDIYMCVYILCTCIYDIYIYIYICICILVAQLCLTHCNPMDCSLLGFSVHGILQARITGVGCHSLLQGIFPTQGLKPGLLHCRWMLYCLSHQRSLTFIYNF